MTAPKKIQQIGTYFLVAMLADLHFKRINLSKAETGIACYSSECLNVKIKIL